ncbi:unnamed protein product [Linum trigynum]|uniref:Uncharacterized protein n=1 Tax=Linum trigynum TaxID=586398 RepID=A0AAV2CYA7_9ROSI
MEVSVYLESIRDLEVELRTDWTNEVIYWKQKSRVEWLQEGDKNTSYFHLVTQSRRKWNFISGLFAPNGSWETEEDGKAIVASDVYSSLFSTDGMDA